MRSEALDRLLQIGEVLSVGGFRTIVGVRTGPVVGRVEPLSLSFARTRKSARSNPRAEAKLEHVAFLPRRRDRVRVADFEEQAIRLVEIAAERVRELTQRLAAAVGAHERRKAREDLPSVPARARGGELQAAEVIPVGLSDKLELVFQRLRLRRGRPCGVEALGKRVIFGAKPEQRRSRARSLDGDTARSTRAASTRPSNATASGVGGAPSLRSSRGPSADSTSASTNACAAARTKSGYAGTLTRDATTLILPSPAP